LFDNNCKLRKAINSNNNASFQDLDIMGHVSEVTAWFPKWVMPFGKSSFLDLSEIEHLWLQYAPTVTVYHGQSLQQSLSCAYLSLPLGMEYIPTMTVYHWQSLSQSLSCAYLSLPLGMEYIPTVTMYHWQSLSQSLSCAYLSLGLGTAHKVCSRLCRHCMCSSTSSLSR
jgi:hypothetical protein